MKYYSEMLGEIFESADDCVKAEKAYKVELEDARAKEAIAAKQNELKSFDLEKQKEIDLKAVDDAVEEYKAAKKKMEDAMFAFCAKYGSYETTSSDINPFDWIFRY